MNVLKLCIGAVSIVTGSFAFNNYREQSHVKRNLEQLKWMDEHTFQSFKTEAEIRLIAQSIKQQEDWLSSWNVFKFSPNVDWAYLPMDQDFIKKFH